MSLLVLLAGAALAVTVRSANITAKRQPIEHYDASMYPNITTWGQLKGLSSLVVIGVAGAPQAVDPQFVEHHLFKQDWTETPVTVERVLLNRNSSIPAALSILQMGKPSTPDQPVVSDFPILSAGTRYPSPDRYAAWGYAPLSKVRPAMPQTIGLS